VPNGESYRFSLDRQVGRRLKDKAEARKEATNIRAAIHAGTFRLRSQRPETVPVTTPEALTLTAYGKVFVKQFSKEARQKRTWRDDERRLRCVAEFVGPDGQRLGDKPIGAITEDDIEAYLSTVRAQGRSASTRNHYLQLFKSLSKWGMKKGHLTRPWLTPESDLKREKPARRHRRLRPDVLDKEGRPTEPGEERLLLQHENPRLQRLIVGALETGCRLGELLGLVWGDVDLGRGELTIRAENAKDNETRILPVSARLKAVLEMAKTDPAGNRFAPTAYVFGDDIGRHVGSMKTAWENAVLLARGITPERTGNGALTATCRAAYRAADLHFHDLRHEAGSRLLEAGWPLHHVKEMLGHADVKTTDTYLNVTRLGLAESMRRFQRCTDVAQKPSDEQRLPCNAAEPVTEKGLIH